MKDGLIVGLLMVVVAMMAYGLFVDRHDLGITSVDPSTPTKVTIQEPVPVVLVAPVHPPGPGPVPGPIPQPGPGQADTPLSKAGRDYMQALPRSLPETWQAMADQIDSGQITDKSGAVALSNTLSAGLNTALDQVFAPGLDSKGKIINKSAITGPLRQSAAALGGH